MALIYMDSFDHYTSYTTKGWTFTGNTGSIAAVGRLGTQGARLSIGGSGQQSDAVRTLPSSPTNIFVGFAWSISVLPGGSGTFFVLQENGTSHITLELTAAGLVRVTRAGTILGTGTIALAPNVFYYIELQAIIHDTTGEVRLRINGVEDVALTNQDTRNGASGFINQVRLAAVTFTASSNLNWDDLYVLDSSGGAPTNTFLGDCRVQFLSPTGNGNSSQFVGNDANSTDNYLLVDEATPNSDTDYVESATVGNKDTYVTGDLASTSGTVYGIQMLPYARKTDAGVRDLATVARLSATEVDSAAKSLSTSYQYLFDVRESKPGGGVWTITDINSAEFGVKVAT